MKRTGHAGGGSLLGLVQSESNLRVEWYIVALIVKLRPMVTPPKNNVPN